MEWNEETVARIAIDPFSTITVAPQLIIEHEPVMSADEWIRANVALIRDIGTEAWLTQVLYALEGKKSTNDLIHPYHVVNIAPRYAVKHDPLVSKELWIGANSNLITRELGVERWLTQFLDVLESDMSPVNTLGFGPFPDVPFSSLPQGDHSLRPSSSPFRGKRRNKKRKPKK
jgi:hypothetical protein